MMRREGWKGGLKYVDVTEYEGKNFLPSRR